MAIRELGARQGAGGRHLTEHNYRLTEYMEPLLHVTGPWALQLARPTKDAGGDGEVLFAHLHLGHLEHARPAVSLVRSSADTVIVLAAVVNIQFSAAANYDRRRQERLYSIYSSFPLLFVPPN